MINKINIKNTMNKTNAMILILEINDRKYTWAVRGMAPVVYIRDIFS